MPACPINNPNLTTEWSRGESRGQSLWPEACALTHTHSRPVHCVESQSPKPGHLHQTQSLNRLITLQKTQNLFPDKFLRAGCLISSRTLANAEDQKNIWPNLHSKCLFYAFVLM